LIIMVLKSTGDEQFEGALHDPFWQACSDAIRVRATTAVNVITLDYHRNGTSPLNATIPDELRTRLSKKGNSSAVYRTVRAEAPSTSANLGSGFDVFGLALDLFHDRVEIELVSEPGQRVDVEGPGHESVPSEVQKNTAGLVAKTVMDAMRREDGLRIKLIKGVPIGKGLGSSAASAACCVRAMDEMFGLALSSKNLVELAAYGELASTGSVHFDNAAAAVLGGFVAVSREPPIFASLKPPTDLEVAVAIPKLQLPEEKTKMMRDILPKVVDLDQVTYNVAHASLLVAGMAISDIRMIGKAMSDSIVEPVRSKTIPLFDKARAAALEAGACGFTISGAGPAVIAVCNRNEVNTKTVAAAMKEIFERGGIECEAYSARPSVGATVIERR
jgi:homoserine kinase